MTCKRKCKVVTRTVAPSTYKSMILPPAVKARVKAFAARSAVPMTRLIEDWLGAAERAVEAPHVNAARLIACAAFKADPSPAMLKAVVTVFGSSLTR